MDNVFGENQNYFEVPVDWTEFYNDWFFNSVHRS
jgi:hypothetical protein